MFTGIIEEIGRVEAAGGRLVVSAPKASADSPPGASVAISGVCLTVVDRHGDRMSFDVSPETLRRSSLGRLEPGDGVNVERPVTLLTRLGGHVVLGHVDGVGEIRSVEPEGDGARMTVAVPDGLGRYVVEKGSVAVDGVSLTVATERDDGFDVALVPYTLAGTTLGSAKAGDPVNLEMDMIAKYVERMARRDR